MKLSAREKILVMILAVVVVLGGGIRFLAVPAYQDLKDKTSQLTELAIKQAAAQASVKAAAGIPKNLDAAKKKASEASKPFFPSLDSDQLQLWVTNITTEKGLAVGNLSVSSPAVDSFKGKGNAASAVIDYPIRDYASAFKGGNAGAQAAQQSGRQSAAQSAGGKTELSGSSVLKASVSMSLTGTYADILEWLDALSGSGRTVKVAQIGLGQNTNGKLSVSVVLDCYGVEKIDDSDSTVNWNLPKPAGKNMM